MSNSKNDAAPYQEYLRNAPKRIPLKTAAPTRVGSLYRLRDALAEELGLERMRGFAITAVLEDRRVEITPVDFDIRELDERHGPMDRMVTGAASPYALPWHVRSGAFLLQRWQKAEVRIPDLEPYLRVASTKAANLVAIHLDEVDEEALRPDIVSHRRTEHEAWLRVFAILGADVVQEHS